jgi:hypothetical protein
VLSADRVDRPTSGPRSYLCSVTLLGVVVGAVAPIGFQLVYVPLATDHLRLTITFFWGIFFLLFEVPAGAIVGALIALVVVGVNAVLPPGTQTNSRALAAGLVSAATCAAVLCDLELLIPGASGFTLAFYAPVVVGLGLVFAMFTWSYFRRHR